MNSTEFCYEVQHKTLQFLPKFQSMISDLRRSIDKTLGEYVGERREGVINACMLSILSDEYLTICSLYPEGDAEKILQESMDDIKRYIPERREEIQKMLKAKE